jgi:hypothetical protein
MFTEDCSGRSVGKRFDQKVSCASAILLKFTIWNLKQNFVIKFLYSLRRVI